MYTASNVLAVGSSLFLVGPSRQLKKVLLLSSLLLSLLGVGVV
jgi:hypothetical protein